MVQMSILNKKLKSSSKLKQFFEVTVKLTITLMVANT